MWGIIPAAGSGSRIQPLAFSKELLPVGSKVENGRLRPKAVCEYLVERMVRAGVTKICFVISSTKSDILSYFGQGNDSVHFSYTIQSNPCGLCDSIFRALPLINKDEQVLVGLPDTIWFPEKALCELPDDIFSLLLFPVKKPEFYDAVELNDDLSVKKIMVKHVQKHTNLIWGAFKLNGKILQKLYKLWCLKGKRDEYFGTLINTYIESGENVFGISAGSKYVDVGTVNGYYESVQLLKDSHENITSDKEDYQEQYS
ncbi:sugar phosphate nucleotidyltransferase [Chitinispirillales bacterium ANBcel5]|uniref:sugar phosphate nucleotidyltransferase n=1 Tax=Cellulosispirillum alkaliphilum TaxID=3039283 RepID=UPI002A54661D|nr:sugar phosphate nucleotidyltransferase [Chitinispirillales bacterium ANBcel5]